MQNAGLLCIKKQFKKRVYLAWKHGNSLLTHKGFFISLKEKQSPEKTGRMRREEMW